MSIFDEANVKDLEKNCIKLYDTADDWMNSFLIGNGIIGGAIYGGVNQECIDLSEITFFSGNASDDNNNKDAYKSFYEMRRLVSEEKYSEAKKAAQDFIGKRHNYGTNLPVGKLIIEFPETSCDKKSYVRSLDIMHGVVNVESATNSYKLHRECFISRKDNKIYYKIETDNKDGLSFSAKFNGHGDKWSIQIIDDVYCFSASAREKVHSDGSTGVNLKGCVLVEETNGNFEISESGIVIKDASYTVLSIAMVTDYKNESFDDVSLTAKSEKTYDEIRRLHMNEFESYMSRVSFRLSGIDDTIEKMFQMGRYLLFSGSSENSPSPAHLQGVWNDNVACQIGWTCDMHLDINTQMNYWLSLEGNLPECNEPLFKWMEDVVIPSGRITAKESYGLEGWSADLVTNIWGYTAPYWHSNISPCPTGGIWTISQYWEYYLHYKDENFLKERVYPVLREAAHFFVGYVFKEGGFYTSGPSISPENSFVKDGETHYFSNGSTYEILMIRELLSQFTQACEVLGVKDEIYDKASDIVINLLPYRVLEDGMLAEWSHNYPAEDKQHRHTSHLLGLYPYNQITPDKTPVLAEAVYRCVKEKLEPYDNWEDTGWARSLLVLYSARLRKTEDAFFHISEMKDKLTSSSLLVMHPPTRGAYSFKEVYELDGNTGFSMGVIEMLMQSHDGAIRLLPALPRKWKSGYIKGLLARGNINVDMTWSEGKLDEAVFKSPYDQDLNIIYNDVNEIIRLDANKPYTVRL